MQISRFTFIKGELNKNRAHFAPKTYFLLQGRMMKLLVTKRSEGQTLQGKVYCKNVAFGLQGKSQPPKVLVCF